MISGKEEYKEHTSRSQAPVAPLYSYKNFLGLQVNGTAKDKETAWGRKHIYIYLFPNCTWTW
jgi:hypothetical protein